MPDRLQRVLQQWTAWPVSHQPVLLETFQHGENHQTFLLEAGDRKLVLKIFREPQPVALQIQQWAAEHMLTPAIIYADRQSNYALMEFCAGEHGGNPLSLARTLASLHSLACDDIAKTSGYFDLLQFYDLYLLDAGQQARRLHQKLMPAIELFLADSTQNCLCHNDLVVENCLTNDQQSCFIDWEYAQLNNPWFDLASVIYYFQMSEKQTRALIESYNSKWLKKLEQPIFYAAHCAFLWTDILWHLARDREDGWPAQQNKLRDIERFAEKLGVYF